MRGKVEIQAAGTLWERQNALLGAVCMPHTAEARRDEDGAQVRFLAKRNVGKTQQKPAADGTNPSGGRKSKQGWRFLKGRQKALPRWTPWMTVVDGRIESELDLEFQLVMRTDDGKEKTRKFRTRLEGDFNRWANVTFRSTFCALLDEYTGASSSAEEDHKPAEAVERSTRVASSMTVRHRLLGVDQLARLPSSIPSQYAI